MITQPPFSFFNGDMGKPLLIKELAGYLGSGAIEKITGESSNA